MADHVLLALKGRLILENILKNYYLYASVDVDELRCSEKELNSFFNNQPALVPRSRNDNLDLQDLLQRTHRHIAIHNMHSLRGKHKVVNTTNCNETQGPDLGHLDHTNLSINKTSTLCNFQLHVIIT